jgi:hypothetical protein
MVMCPKWGDLPPIALAYIKGAVRRRSVRCFDFNHELLKQFVPDYRQKYDYNAYCTDIVPFMFRQPDFETFERGCAHLSRQYADIFDQWVDRLKDYGVVGFSLYQENLAMSVALARRLRREHGIVCIAGGPSVNMDDRVFLHRLLGDGTFSLGVLGIAEDVIDELLDRVIAGRSLADVPGLAIPATRGRVFCTPAKRPSLARFSPPDYSDFELDDYRVTALYIYAVLGCVGRCEFCTIHEFYPGYQHKPVEHIQQEMLLLHQRHGKTQFVLSDGMFLGNRQDALVLFDFAIAHGFTLRLQIRLLPYWDDEELIAKAAQCVYFLQVGFESASANVRKAMGKMIDARQTRRIYQLLYRYKLPLFTNIIVGYPNESDGDFEETYHFLDEYLVAENHRVGSNVFFIANGFPAEKYNIHTDGAGHWASQNVNFYDRLDRVSRMCRLVEERGRPWMSVYGYPVVEGVPVGSVSPAPGELEGIRIDRYVETTTLSFGSLDRLDVADHYLQAWGWAKLPDRNEPGQEVLLLDPQGRIIARALVGQDRSDVAEQLGAPSLERCGWVCVFRRSVLDCPPESLRAYLYTAGDRTAWQLACTARPAEGSSKPDKKRWLKRPLQTVVNSLRGIGQSVGLC